MPLKAQNANCPYLAQIWILAVAIAVPLGDCCSAQAHLRCIPAVDGTVGIGNGTHPLPGGSPLSTYGLTEGQGSVCGLSIGASSSRGADDFDQRIFGSYTYTLGYIDFSAGFTSTETKVRTYFGDAPNSLTPRIVRRDRVNLSSALHPTKHSEINALWGLDVHDRDWIVGIRGIDRLWSSPHVQLYGYFNYDRFREDKAFQDYGGDLYSGGVRLHRKVKGPISLYGELGFSCASAAVSNESRQNATVLLGLSYRHAYYDSAEIGRIGIRDH